MAQVPPPDDTVAKPLRALIFDSYYDLYRGVVVYFRVMDGSLKKGDRVKLMASGKEYDLDELGILSPNQIPVNELHAGEVGYFAAAIKSVTDARVGDTMTLVNHAADDPLPGYVEAKPMVFCGMFPTDAGSISRFKGCPRTSQAK